MNAAKQDEISRIAPLERCSRELCKSIHFIYRRKRAVETRSKLNAVGRCVSSAVLWKCLSKRHAGQQRVGPLAPRHQNALEFAVYYKGFLLTLKRRGVAWPPPGKHLSGLGRSGVLRHRVAIRCGRTLSCMCGHLICAEMPPRAARPNCLCRATEIIVPLSSGARQYAVFDISLLDIAGAQ